ncbi:hypothetical protein CROQUDRAFT_101303, partial [Cronartium quercuum f. sp. fusiforme G11]
MALFSSHQNPLRNTSRLADPSPEDQTRSPLNHLRPQLPVPSPLHEGTLEPFSEKTREANFYGLHESLAAFGNQGPSAAKQTTVLQREGMPDELQDRLEGHLEMFTNTYQGLNENLDGALLLPMNHAAIAAEEIPFSRYDFRSINNAPNKGVLLPSEFLSNDNARANPTILPFSTKTRKANFYGSHESLAAFKQTKVPQHEGLPDDLQDRMEGRLEMFTNTYQGLNENLNGALLVPMNQATIAAEEIPFSRHNFRSINNAPNKGVLLPSEFLSNDDARANPTILPFSTKTRKANFYGLHESLAAFKQTKIPQREGLADDLQD